MNFVQFIEENALEKVFEARLKGSTTSGRDGISAASLNQEQIDSLISFTKNKLLAGNYKFAPYKQILHLKGKGKFPREISIPNLRDRLVFAVLADYLRKEIPSIEFPRPQRIISDIRHSISSGEYRDFIRLDLVAFYPSISHSVLAKSLRNLMIEGDVVDLIISALKTPTVSRQQKTVDASIPNIGVPSGTAIANVLGEIVLSSFDKNLRSLQDLSYSRYVDDILILAPHGRRGQITSEIKTLLDNLELKSHPKSSREKSSSGKLNRDGFEYLGYSFEPGRITVHKSRQINLIDGLARPITMLSKAKMEGQPDDLKEIRDRAKWWLDLRITGCIAGNARRGWIQYYSQVDDISIFHKLNATVNSLLGRLPREIQFEPKSFVKAYTLTRNPSRDASNYIPNFDAIIDSEDYVQMRKILSIASTRSPAKDLEVLQKQFRNFVSFATKELETDVGELS